MDLFKEKSTQKRRKNLPLAVRMRPENLDEFVGQLHLLGKGKLLRRCIEADKINSLILYGPPGTGKTALAHVISNLTNAYFEQINAVTSNVKQLRKIITIAKNREKTSNRRTILFIDEVHRFNKTQQDVLIPEVERAVPILIGATTHNPFFSIVPPLISRSLVFELKPLEDNEIKKILDRAVKDKKGFRKLDLVIFPEAINFIVTQSDGDARRALNALELGTVTTLPDKNGKINFDLKAAQECMQKKLVKYDHGEDFHYDIISAYIKSVRGSNPDAAIYWLAKMLYAGEDPLFIARRLVICAAEDIGNADPQALNIANAAMQITQFIGMPECQIPLSQATIYLACSPKSNASYEAIKKAMQDVKEKKDLEVPQHLKDSHYKSAKKLGHGEGYKYAHNFQEHYVQQEYIPEERRYYFPSKIGFEQKIYDRLKKLRSKHRKS